MNKKIAIFSFYSFVNIKNKFELQAKITMFAKKKMIYGTIIFADEGFNGSISGNENDLHELLKKIVFLTNAKDLNLKINYSEKQPFSKIKVKLKKEIVAMKLENLDVENLKGTYVESKDWDDFIKRDDVVTIDTRNDYEVKIGTFKGSIDPKTKSFREFPHWTKSNMDIFENKKVAMFCTGGIRCEKSTALLKKMGVKEVFHLNGGILQYLEETKNKNKIWQGECFVFDDRGAVSENLLPSEGFWVEKGQTAKGVSMSK